MKNTKIFTDTINGIDLSIIDEENSETPVCVFRELKEDLFYGISNLDIKPEDTIIDVGANTGIFSIYAKKLYGCKIIAFEPVPANFENFKKNIVLNGFSLEDFEIHQVAITGKDGDIINIGTPTNNSGASSTFIQSDSSHFSIGYTSECVTETLGKYINSTCVYLKMDCEGGEYDIIPTILDKLNFFKWIGAEIHIYNPNQDPGGLINLINTNFNGKLFYGVIIPGQ